MEGTHYRARKRQISRAGRAMTLRRYSSTSSHVDVAVTGTLSQYTPEQIGVGEIQQGDGTVAIMNDEILAAGWPGPPRNGDRIVIDGRTWAVKASFAVYERDNLIGHNIYVRGS